MKNKTIIFVSIFAICILLLMPNISAIEYNTVKDKISQNRNDLIENIQSTINPFINRFKNIEININLLLTILIKGIILPIIILTLSHGATSALINMLPTTLAPIIVVVTSFISGFIVGEFFLIPILELINEQTGSYIFAVIVYFLLAFFDIKVAGSIARILFDF